MTKLLERIKEAVTSSTASTASTAKAAPGSLEARISGVSGAWSEAYSPQQDSPVASPEGKTSWVREVFDDHVIVCIGDEHYSVPYTETDGEFEFDTEAATEVEQSWTEVTKTITVTKIDEDRQVVFGWAYVSEKADGEQVVDHSGEFVEKEDLEDAAYEFVMLSRAGDERHTPDVKAALIESFLVTPEKLEKMGLPDDALPRGWWTGWYVDDADVFGKIRDGEYEMPSIGGRAHKEVVDA